MINKDSSHTLKYHAYNYGSYDTKTNNNNNYSNYFGDKIKNTFMCACFISK